MDKPFIRISNLQLVIGIILFIIWAYIWRMHPEHNVWPMATLTALLAHRVWQLPKSYRIPILINICDKGLFLILILILMGQTLYILPTLAVVQLALITNLIIKDKP